MKLSRKAYLVIIPAFIAGNVQARAYIADSNPEYICAQGIYEPSDSSRTIEEIAVVARSNRVVVPGQTLSGEELNALGSHSVADAIRYFSGVEIKDYGGVGGLKTVNIRSMGSKHVGVFYDGLQINNAQNGVVDLGRLSLENMEAVSLYNGQKSAIFQPAKDFASSSAIYLTTRKPSFEGKTKHNLKATVKSGSFGLIDPSLLWEGRLSKNLSASVNAEYLYTNGRYKYRTSREAGYETTEVRRNGDIRA